MVRWLNLFQFVSLVGVGVAGCLVPPLLVGFLFHDDGVVPLALSVTIALGLALVFGISLKWRGTEFSHREGILFVVIAWLVAAVLGAFPFYLSPAFNSFTDAFFESISGFTTTGASVLSDVEALPPSLNFWRCFTHWIGGMGIILLSIAILPLIGGGGVQLYRAEFSGARSAKIKPRVAETAKTLWTIYASMTIAEYLALRLVGMTRLDAACHTFSTMGTGGFSTRNSSVAAFDSPAIELIIIFFMLLAGINFTMHYRLLTERKPRRFFGDVEIRAYLIIAALVTIAIGGSLVWVDLATPLEAVRMALFQTVSIMTTTGFTSANFEVWPPIGQLLLLLLMFAGGCTGSTAGGLKTARMVLLTRVVGREFRKVVSPRAIVAIRLNRDFLSEDTVQSLLNLVYLSLLMFALSGVVLTGLGLDMLTALSATAASMFNVGPGFGSVGPLDNYGHLPTLGKWVLSFCMLAGRLEFFTLLVIFTRAFWRR